MVKHLSALLLSAPLVVSVKFDKVARPLIPAHPSSILSNRRTDISPQCELEMAQFDDVNILFSDGVDTDPFCIERNETPTSIEFFCDFDYLTGTAQESCEDIGGNLYNLKIEQKCIEEIPGFGQYIIDLLHINAYVCLGVSCEVQNFLYKLEEEAVGDNADECPISLTAEWVPTKSTHSS